MLLSGFLLYEGENILLFHFSLLLITLKYGVLAQLGERYTGSVEVSGSIPLCSTKKRQSSDCLFLSNPQDWYVIAVRRMSSPKVYLCGLIIYLFLKVLHTQLYCDYIPFATDAIHGFAVILFVFRACFCSYCFIENMFSIWYYINIGGVFHDIVRSQRIIDKK